jgi:hypothetical protein
MDQTQYMIHGRQGRVRRIGETIRKKEKRYQKDKGKKEGCAIKMQKKNLSR